MQTRLSIKINLTKPRIWKCCSIINLISSICLHFDADHLLSVVLFVFMKHGQGQHGRSEKLNFSHREGKALQRQKRQKHDKKLKSTVNSGSLAWLTFTIHIYFIHTFNIVIVTVESREHQARGFVYKSNWIKCTCIEFCPDSRCRSSVKLI